MNDDERALLDAIAADPDSDEPRLIYADWLEEQGDPRGEFVRVQCELAHMAEDDPRRVRLVQREYRLLQQHAADWHRPLWDACRVDQAFVWCERGLVQHVNVENDFRNPEKLLQHAPVLRSLSVAPAAPMSVVERVLDSPVADQLQALTVSGVRFDEATLKKLAGCERLRNLRVLGMDGCGLGDDGLRLLCRNPAFTRLVEWRLASNDLTDEGMAALAQAPLPKLTTLHFGRMGEGSRFACRVSREGFETLAASETLHALEAVYVHDVFSLGATFNDREEQLPRGEADAPLEIRYRADAMPF